MSHPRTRTLARGIHKRGNSYYLDYKDETSLKIVLDSYLDRQRVYSKPKSVRNAKSSIRRLTLHFGDPVASELSTAMVDAFIEKRRRDAAARTNPTPKLGPVLVEW